jgi:murein DD-endopeptidase MepM/ murein hydrolase activator NlpD
MAALSLLCLANCATVAPSEQSYRPAPGTAFVVAVRPGDSISEIAQRYRVSTEDIVAMNGLSDRDRVVAGARLFIPAYGRREGAAPRPAPARTQTAQRTARSTATPARPSPAGRVQVTQLQPVSYDEGPSLVPIPRQRPGAGTRTASRTPASQIYVPAARPVSVTVPAGAARFVWPVNGRILSGFGRNAEGQRNDGINIAVAHGTPVRAAANGTVTYVGNELKGYGNLLLIQHDGGFVTAYAHADRLTVERGERVKSGDIVGYTGATGDVTQPQLHFEIRQNTKPVNPTAFLGGSQTQANRLPREPARS